MAHCLTMIELDYDYAGSEKTGLDTLDRSQGCSGFMAYFNVVCVIAGTGTLGLPYALAQGGWIGILILCLAWWMSTVSVSFHHLLCNIF